jgi:mannose-6-phosphate isomerase-like protein (cupin superfamily)
MTHATNHDTITVGVFDLRFLIESADSNGSAAVFECSVPAGARMSAPSNHPGFDESIYGLEGITTWTIDGETVEIGPGEAVCVTRRQTFGFENHGGVDARFLAIATPAVVGPAYFRELGANLAAAGGGPPDTAAIGAMRRRHDRSPTTPGAR